MIFIHRESQSIRSMLVERVFRHAQVSGGPDSPPPRFIVRQYTKSLLTPEPPRGIRARLEVKSFSIAGSHVHVLVPRFEGCGRCVLYLHGGSYIATFTRQHWNFLAKIAEKTRSVIIAPDYPLAPEHRWAETYRLLFALWERMGEFLPRKSIVLMGDSAGGGLALGFVQALRDARLALPASVIMLSPWLDVTLENPDIGQLSPVDPFLNIGALRTAGRAWAGRSNPRRMEISPVYGHFEGLPPLSLFIGTKDVLLADCRRLWNICAVTGAPLDYYEYEHMLHVWMLLPIRESEHAVAQIMGILATQAQCADIDAVLKFSREDGT
jgi:acetyl esterase/lipase